MPEVPSWCGARCGGSTFPEGKDDAAPKFARAKSEANLAKRLPQSDTAHPACEQAMALDDQRAMLRHLLREPLQFCSPHGRLRTVAHVRSELTRLFDMIEDRNCAALTLTLQPIRTPIDDIVVPFAQAEAIHTALHAVVPHDA